MAEKLPIPPAIYDYVLFYECAQKDWTNYKNKMKIKGDGSLMNSIKWDIGYSYHPNDTGGNTKFGITESTWQGFVKAYPNKGYSSNLNSIRKDSWMAVMQWFWDTYSYASISANYACATLLFQMAWGGFSGATTLLNNLKSNADKKDYKYISKGSSYKKIADATHAFTEPMKAFNIMRNSLLSHYYNISRPDYVNKKGVGKNAVFRVGWFNRAAIPFTVYGLYACTTIDGKRLNMSYSSTIPEWDNAITKHIQNGSKGMVKLLDWGVSPETIGELAADSSSYNFTPNDGSGYGSASNYSSGAYGGCGGVYQLGNYSNAPDAQIIPQQIQNRDEVLQTLINGSYTPDAVKKCEELITVEKKKNVKTKSET